jgi:hypothetical protein
LQERTLNDRHTAQKIMTDPATNSTRRDFLANALKLGAGPILIGASTREGVAAEAT